MSEMIKNYELLNKDCLIAAFHLDTELDMITIDTVFGELPPWLSNLRAFITNRRSPKHRENIADLLKMSGCDTLQGYLDITHALSLVDTFWVRPVGSLLHWEDVSLYTHPFNETIAKTAFEGGLHGMGLSTTSPEYGTDGTFAKCWIRENDVIKMLKRGSSGARNAGLEPYSEFYASQIIRHFTDRYVEYGLRTHNSRICSVCDCFTTEQYGYLPYAAVDKGNTTVLDIIDKMASYGLEDKIKTMFVVDAVIFNEDRHKNNFGFLVDNDRQEIVDMAPLFDHNISLLPYAEEEEFANLPPYLEMKGPRIGDDFYRTARYCLTPSLRKALIQLDGFRFERHPKYNLPEWRLEELEKLVQSNIRKVLGER
ncbi:MAG: HipA protein [Eubacteriales bacterium]|nr:HipA protein [Eubacteriales bacterium]